MNPDENYVRINENNKVMTVQIHIVKVTLDRYMNRIRSGLIAFNGYRTYFLHIIKNSRGEFNKFELSFKVSRPRLRKIDKSEIVTHIPVWSNLYFISGASHKPFLFYGSYQRLSQYVGLYYRTHFNMPASIHLLLPLKSE